MLRRVCRASRTNRSGCRFNCRVINKNPGGGLAKIGGYIAGRKDLIERCGYRLTAPGIGKEAGASLFSLQEMYQGFFSTACSGSKLKGSLFTSLLLEK